MGVFYSDDIMIRLRQLEWIQRNINVLIGLFTRVGLITYVVKYKTITFQPVEIHASMSEEPLSWRSTG